jgi:hypothetical protein
MRVIVNQSDSTHVRVNQSGTSQVVTVGVQGPAGPNFINLAEDVDVTNLTNGSLLIYKANTQKWTSSTLLENQSMEAGEY